MWAVIKNKRYHASHLLKTYCHLSTNENLPVNCQYLEIDHIHAIINYGSGLREDKPVLGVWSQYWSQEGQAGGAVMAVQLIWPVWSLVTRSCMYFLTLQCQPQLSALSTWPIHRFWHYQPLHSTLQTPSYFWHFWHCSVLVSVIPLWLNSGCKICQWCFLCSCFFKLRCPPGVSVWSYSLCPLHPSYFWNCVLSLSFTSQFLWWQPAYKSGNITQLPEIIHSTQSCISDVDGK